MQEVKEEVEIATVKIGEASASAMNADTALDLDFTRIIQDMRSGLDHEVYSAVSNMRQKTHGLPLSTRFGTEEEEEAMFSPVVEVLTEESGDKLKSTLWKNLRTVFSEKHKVMLSLYMKLSKVFAEMDDDSRLPEALEYTGRAVLSCKHINGILSEDTAQCHLRLGLLYKKMLNNETAKKQLNISKGIYKKIHGPLHEIIAQCDYELGQIELQGAKIRPDRTYNAFYNSFRARMLLFGPDHISTIEAKKWLIKSRNVKGTQYVSAIELADRVQELKWEELGPQSIQYNFSSLLAHISRGDECTMTHAQVRNVIAAANRFAHSKGHSSPRGSPAASPGSSLLGLGSSAFSNSPSSSSYSHLSPSRILSDESSYIALPEENIELDKLAAQLLESSISSDDVVTPPISAAEIRQAAAGQVNGQVQVANSNESALSLSALNTNSTPTRSPAVKIAFGPRLERKTTFVETEGEVSEISLPLDTEEEEDTGTGTEVSIIIVEGVTPTASPVAIRSSPRASPTPSPIEKESKRASTLVMPHELRVQMEGQLKALEDLDTGLEGIEQEKLPFALGSRLGVMGRDSDNKPVLITSLAKGIDTLLSESYHKASLLKRHEESKSRESRMPIPPPVPTDWPDQGPIPPLVLSVDEAMGLLVKTIEGGEGADKGKGGKIGTFAAMRAAEKEAARFKRIDFVPLSEEVDVKSSLWGRTITEYVPIEQLFEDLEDEFIKEIKKKEAKALRRASMSKRIAQNAETSGTKKSEKHEAPAIDPRRAQNLAIMLSKFGKISCAEIAKSILDFNVNFVGVAELLVVQENLPTPEEFSSVEKLVEKWKGEYSKDKHGPKPADVWAASKLGKPESFIYHFGRISRVNRKIDAMMLILSARETADKGKKSADAMHSAATEVISSDRLRYLLHIILRLFNAVNERSLSDSADSANKGFSLAALASLSKTKTNSGETAEQYLVSRVFLHLPESLDVGADMPNINLGKDVLITRLRADTTQLKSSVQSMKALLELEEAEPTGENSMSEGGLTKMKEMLVEAAGCTSHAERALQDTNEDFQQICEYFAEDPSKTTPEKIFGVLVHFIRSIEHTTQHVKEKFERKNKQKKQQTQTLK